MRRNVLCCIIILFCWLSGSASLRAQFQRPVANSYSNTIHLITHLDRQLNVPLPLISRYSLRTLLIFGATAYIISRSDAEFDEEYALEHHSTGLKVLMAYGRVGKLYDNKYAFPLIGGISAAAVGYGLLYQKNAPVETVQLMAQTLAISTLVTTVLKLVVGRHRPYSGDGPFQFDWFAFKRDSRFMSFPSGHTASVFALMTVFAKQVRPKWLRYSAYSFAGSVAFQRMLDRKHWASDVIAGGVIGYLIGNAVVNRHRQGHIKKVTLCPYLDGIRTGIGINF